MSAIILSHLPRIDACWNTPDFKPQSDTEVTSIVASIIQDIVSSHPNIPSVIKRLCQFLHKEIETKMRSEPNPGTAKTTNSKKEFEPSSSSNLSTSPKLPKIEPSPPLSAMAKSLGDYAFDLEDTSMVSTPQNGHSASNIMGDRKIEGSNAAAEIAPLRASKDPNDPKLHYDSISNSTFGLGDQVVATLLFLRFFIPSMGYFLKCNDFVEKMHCTLANQQTRIFLVCFLH
jgi:hypothetical protein